MPVRTLQAVSRLGSPSTGSRIRGLEECGNLPRERKCVQKQRTEDPPLPPQTEYIRVTKKTFLVEFGDRLSCIVETASVSRPSPRKRNGNVNLFE